MKRLDRMRRTGRSEPDDRVLAHSSRGADRGAARGFRCGGVVVRGIGVLVLAALFELASSGVASAAAGPPERIDPAASCVNSDCHASTVAGAVLHWPKLAEPKQCQRCHEVDGDQHEFESDDSVEACLGCHEELAAKMGKAQIRHEAAEDGCLDCHDPHGGETKAMLVDVKEDDLRPLCFTCHDEDILQQEFEHGPAAGGECNMCHDLHASDLSNLLIAEGMKLCGDCHEEVAEAIAESEHVHDPAEDDCTDCHNPHSGPAPNMLRAEGRKLCDECHDDIVSIAEDSAVDHAPATTEDECVTCHSPHAGNSAPNLRKPQRELCLGCHDRRVKSGRETLQDIEAWLRENDVWHKPVIEDDCSGCHNPHGSEHFRLLKEPFPARFYTSFEVGKYALCFSCHEKTVVTTKKTRSLTGFRNGDVNMHFLHVNREKRGRSCRACHEMHASEQPLHISERVPYGRWMMPINYDKSETGGSCRPGCHDLKGYDRETPIKNAEKKKE